MAYTVVLEGGSPWGFRLDGGLEFKEPLRIAKINSNSKAYNQGIQIGDRVDTINGRATHGLPHHEALQLIRNANKTLTLQLEKQKGQGKSLVQRSTGKQITKRSHTQPIPTIRINGTSPPLHGTAPEISGYLNGEVGGHRFHSFSQKGERKNYSYKPVKFSGAAGASTSNGSSTSFSHTNGHHVNTTPSSSFSQSSTFSTNSIASTSTSSITTSSSSSVTSSHRSFDDTDLRPAHSTTTTAHTEPVNTTHPGKWAPVATMLGHQDDETNDNKYRSLPHTWSPAHGASQPKKDYRPMHVDPSSMDNTFASRAPGHTTASNTVTTTTTTTSSVGSPTSTSYTAWNGTISHFSETKSGLPQSQSPTITLLQKSREGQIPKGAIYVGTQKSQEGGVEHTDMYYMAPAPEEAVVEHRTKEVKAPRYKGIGPVDKGTGMPVGLRTSVDEKSQKDWYKNMYKSLHKTDKPTDWPENGVVENEEVNTYKPTYQFPESDGEKEEKEEPNPYKPSYEFPSRTIDIHSKKSSARVVITPPPRPPPPPEFKVGGVHVIETPDVESGPLYSTKSLDRQSSRDPPKKSTSLWSPAHARYKDEKYRNQPLSITDYEPGFSSIAFKEARVDDEDAKRESQLYNPPIEKPGQFSRYVDNDTSNIKVKKLNRSLSPTSDFEVRKVYKEIQKGGDVPIGGLGIPYPEKKERSFQSPERRVSGTDEYPRSPANTLDRRRRDEENARRRDYMEQMFAEEKRRRMAEEVANNEARRHSDWFTDDKYWLKLAGLDKSDTSPKGDPSPSQKSPIPSADRRFDEGMDAAELARPTKKASYQVRGKCKALYNFTAQNPRELSFRKGDIIYLTRMIDSNWYEGEHHGRVGIFPENHVEIVTSLETATAIALKKEGTAVAKYNFNAQTSVEMSLRKGDVVHVIRRIDENWFEGRHGDRQGIFPSQYVDIMKEPETPLTMTPMSSLAPTPAAGSPSQLSPCSTISNGPAPTIPDAPLSPFSSSKYDEQFDWLNHQFEQLNSDGGPSSAQTHMSVQLQQHSYRPDSYGGASTVPMPPSEPHRFQTQHQVSPQYSATTQNGYGPGAASSAPGSYQSLERKKRQDFRDYESRMSTGPPPGPATKKEGYGYRKYKEEDPIYPRYRSIFRYMPQNEDELELQEGDTVYVMEKCDDGWFVGTSERTKEFGTFPGNYVQPL